MDNATSKINISDDEKKKLAEQFRMYREERALKIAEFKRGLEEAELDITQLIDKAAELMCNAEEMRLAAVERREEERKKDFFLNAKLKWEGSDISRDVVLRGSPEVTDQNGRPILEPLCSLADADAYISKKRAGTGGAGRAAKFKRLEEETIRLYLEGKWASVPAAALDITPKIVAMSKNGNGDLFDSTTKPLEWIRAYVKGQKSSPS